MKVKCVPYVVQFIFDVLIIYFNFQIDGVLKDTLSSSGIKAQMAAQIIKICEAVERIIPNYNKPFLALHGSADGQCDPAGSQTLYQNAKSDDKTLKVIFYLN